MSDKELDAFNPLLKEIADFVSSGGLIKIDSVETCGRALLSVKQVKLLSNAVEDRRKETVSPWNEKVKSVNTYAKKLLEPLLKAEAQIKSELISWEKKLEKEREEQKRIAEEKHLQEREELDAARRAESARADVDSFFGGSDHESSVRDRDLFAASQGLREAQKQDLKEIEANKVRGAQKFWTFKIVDELRVPIQYKVVDLALIRIAIKSGQREIPGLEIYQDTRVAIL